MKSTPIIAADMVNTKEAPHGRDTDSPGGIDRDGDDNRDGPVRADAGGAEQSPEPAKVESLVGDTKPIPNHLPNENEFGMALVGSFEDDDLAFETLETVRTWRREVVSNGRYWIWRKGSGKKRESKFGGKFSTMPKERQQQYYVNRAIYHAYRQAAAERDGRTYRARNAGKRDDVLH